MHTRWLQNYLRPFFLSRLEHNTVTNLLSFESYPVSFSSMANVCHWNSVSLDYYKNEEPVLPSESNHLSWTELLSHQLFWCYLWMVPSTFLLQNLKNYSFVHYFEVYFHTNIWEERFLFINNMVGIAAMNINKKQEQKILRKVQRKNWTTDGVHTSRFWVYECS